MHVLQGILSDGRTLLLAVPPAASPSVKSATAAAMAAGATAALQASGMAISVHGKEEMLPWKAFHAMAHMVRARSLSWRHVRIKLACACCADHQNSRPLEAFCCLSAATGGTGGSLWRNTCGAAASSQCAAASVASCCINTATLLTGDASHGCTLQPVHPVHWQHIKPLMRLSGCKAAAPALPCSG